MSIAIAVQYCFQGCLTASDLTSALLAELLLPFKQQGVTIQKISMIQRDAMSTLILQFSLLPSQHAEAEALLVHLARYAWLQRL